MKSFLVFMLLNNVVALIFTQINFLRRLLVVPFPKKLKLSKPFKQKRSLFLPLWKKKRIKVWL
jgi:hypothetical protein